MINISYSLFSQKASHSNRSYDPSNGASDRYWFNLPAVIIANSIFYPNSKTILHLGSDLVSHPLFPFIDHVSNNWSGFSIQIMNHSYGNTEPTLWRMFPVWNGENDTICRDIDSLPNEAEFRRTKAFLDSHFIVHNIRSHPNHNSYLTKVLAGLCGFKKECKNHLAHDFEQFYRMANRQWGCDQSVLMHYWVDRVGVGFVKNCFLDSPVSCIGPMCEDIGGFDAGKLPIETYNSIDVSHINYIDMFNGITHWCGQPIDARGEVTRTLIDSSSSCAKIVKESMNDHARSFYGV